MIFLLLATSTMSKTIAQLCVVSSLTLLAGAHAFAQAPAVAAGTAPAAAAAPANCPAILKQTFKRLQDEAPQDLCQYSGKVILVVNTASYCGFTNQYEGLEAMYAKYGGKGLVVLGFPSNDFGAQEPGSSQEIASFCEVNYGVTFPLFGKTSVSKGAANPFFAKLEKATGSAPRWNFHKYLVDRRGEKALAFDTKVDPSDPKLVKEIERLLAEK